MLSLLCVYVCLCDMCCCCDACCYEFLLVVYTECILTESVCVCVCVCLCFPSRACLELSRSVTETLCLKRTSCLLLGERMHPGFVYSTVQGSFQRSPC